MKKKRIGLLGGTFDPLHFGHINLGIEMQEKHQLDEILVCPAASSPFKQAQAPVADSEMRLQMARLGIEGIPGWRLLDWEIKRKGPSYTIDTVREILEEGEKNKEKIALFLLLGEDIMAKLDEWKEVDQLLALAPPLIGVRAGFPKGLPLSLEKICHQGMTHTRLFDVSSTLVRERLKRRLYCGHLIPAKILDFIYHHQLYFK